MTKEFHFIWQWDLLSSPEAIWPFASDTNRFNRDTGQPEVEVLSNVKGVKQMRMRLPIIRVEWEEEPFEWTYPYSFGVSRLYSKGPVDSMRTEASFERLPNNGTHVTYHSWFVVSNIFVQLLIPFAIGVIAKNRFTRVFRLYDRIANRRDVVIGMMPARGLSSAGRARFKSLSETVIRQGTDASLMARLDDFLERADELSVQRIRPYALADRWHVDRRTVLEMFLRATRAGILDMSWDLLCPSCRGTTEGHTNLGDVHGSSHCNTCQIDFTVNFDHNIEVIFRPNPSVRMVDFDVAFCAGSPQLQPHMVMSQSLSALHSLPVPLELERGRYSLRASNAPGSISLYADEDGLTKTDLRVSSFGWPPEQQRVSLHPTLNLVNATETESTFQLERTAWSDESSTAADVTALLAGEGGSIVKTMGDAVMATFRHPIDALKAIWKAQSEIAEHGEPMLWLKAGLHKGPCIVVNLNERLDYFGSTVNIAARLPNFSQGGELIFSEAFHEDPEIRDFLAQNVGSSALTCFTGDVKGFDEPFTMWKVRV